MSDVQEAPETTETSGMGIGTMVLLVLGVLTVIEYLIAVSKPPGQLALIFVIAIGKAWLILVYFMHVKQLWKKEAH
ncbi:MAG: cytochrome C oxidase subunit IV family protein [Actinomycetia bacterium]|nr:cytochrome C oxidase subunit IV family protein [Actinomycetes bacterium]